MLISGQAPPEHLHYPTSSKSKQSKAKQSKAKHPISCLLCDYLSESEKLPNSWMAAAHLTDYCPVVSRA
jgi:hypothetical protein